MTNKTGSPKISTQRIKGVLYAFEDFPYWDAGKKQTRHRRNYIGKIDDNGNLVPNKVYEARLQLERSSNASPVTNEKKTPPQRLYYGASHLLECIGNKIGVVDDLKACFPDDYQKILSLAWYLVLETDSPMYRFKKWSTTHHHPLDAAFSDQRISELFASVQEDAKMAFFALQSKRRLEREYLAYDTTSISSYSELIDQVKYGNNKDGEPLPQINLALVFGEKSMLPVYFRKLPGNIPDVKTLRKLLKDVAFLDMKKVKLVMDRGFYSAENIDAMYSNHYKFLIGARGNVDIVSALLDTERDNVKDFNNYNLKYDVYCLSRTGKWTYGQNTEAPESRRIYMHLYYNGQRAEAEKASFIRALATAKQALHNGKASEEQQQLCNRYFIAKSTPTKGLQIEYDENKIQKRLERCGYFVLLSNEIKDCNVALEIYRNKDLVEKAFSNLKNRLDMKRTAVSSSESLEGKLFVQFIALIYVSYIHKCMKEKGLYEHYTMQTLLDELDVIERFRYSASNVHYSEITKKQRLLFDALDVPSPDML